MTTPLTRPDGRAYRPRSDKLRAHAWENPDREGVIVFGTVTVTDWEAQT